MSSSPRSSGGEAAAARPGGRAGAARALVMTDRSLHAAPATGTLLRLGPGLWRVVAPNPSPLTGPGTNTYVLTGARNVVIDPGCDDPAHLARILEAAGGTIDEVLCTHSHPDHSPGAGWLAARTGARVRGRPAPDDGHQDPAYAPHAGLEDGERIDAGDFALRALHTPGHASNHVCFLLEPSGLLFTGDHLMSGSTVVIIPPDGSMRAYLESLSRLREMPVARLAPGHGAVMPDALAEIDRVIVHRRAREDRVIRALERRTVATLVELLPEVYADVPVALHGYARYSLLAHLVKLVEEGRVALDGELYRWGVRP
jgi:glyoxylase-like metal-dependent hydrolase (beta-lactamase superfamily II)